MNGPGTYTFPDGSSIEAEWLDNKPATNIIYREPLGFSWTVESELENVKAQSRVRKSPLLLTKRKRNFNFKCRRSRSPLEIISGPTCLTKAPRILLNPRTKVDWSSPWNRRKMPRISNEGFCSILKIFESQIRARTQSSLYIDGTLNWLTAGLNRGFSLKLYTVFFRSRSNFSYSLLSFMEVQHLCTHVLVNICFKYTDI